MKIWKKYGRRPAALLLVLVMAVSLAACGGKKESDSGSGSGSSGSGAGTSKKTGEAAPSMPEITSKDGVARAEEIRINDPDFATDGLQIFAMEDGWFYGFNYSYEGDGLEGYELVRFKTDGSGLTKVSFGDPDSGEEIMAASFKDGKYYLVLVSYSNSPALDYMLEHEGEEEIEIPEDLSEDAVTTYSLCCVSKEGDVVWKNTIEEPEDSLYFYVSSIEPTQDGINVITSEGVTLYSAEDGSVIEEVCAVKEEDLMGSLYVLRDGTVVLMDESGTNTKICTYDSSSDQFVDSLTLPSMLQGAMLFPGSKYDFYLCGDEGIYGANLGSDTLAVVVNYVNSDLDVQSIIKVIENEDGKLSVQAYGNDTSLVTCILTLVDPKDVQDRTELTLGGYYIDFTVRSEVIRFNKENSKYRIMVRDYSQYDLENDDYNNPTGLTRLNTDIASGNAPDIMFLNAQMPVNSFISKGVFEDLTDRYTQDTEIDKADFLDNIREAFLSEDGRMYVLVPGFTVTGVSGKEKYIGDGKDLTIKKAKEIAAKNNIQDSAIFGVTDRDTVFQSAIEFSGDQFIDWKNHTCNFNSDEFRELLEFVKAFPTAISEEQYNDYFTQYLADKALLGIQYLSTVYDYSYMTRDLFGDLNVTLTGFPSKENKGPSIAAYLEFGISSSAADPDGCWSFVRRFLLPDFQMNIDGCFPVSEKAIDAQGQAIIDSIREYQEMNQQYLDELNAMPENTADDTMAEGEDEADVDAAGMEELTGDGWESDAFEESETVEDEPGVTNMLGKPVPEEDFDGTHEEYEQYLKDFEEQMAQEGSMEMVVYDEDDLMTDDADVSSAYGKANLPEFGEQDIETVKNILKSLHFAVNGETEVLNIISEEAEAFFAGQKSAEEVSDIIQSRVTVYVKENE